MTLPSSTKSHRKFPWLALLPILVGLACLGLYLVNQFTPAAPASTGKLMPEDSLYAAEARHLKAELGESLWTGWGKAEIPLVLFDEKNAYLLGDPLPARGWIRPPRGEFHGTDWQMVDGATFEGKPYFYQTAPNADKTIGAFMIQIGNRWAASMTTRSRAQTLLFEQMRNDMPTALKPFVPYTWLFHQMFSPPRQVSMYLHETFHVHEVTQAPQKLLASELAFTSLDSKYPYQEEHLNALVKEETDLLAKALATSDDTQARELVRQFLDVREKRRAAINSFDYSQYEKLREWSEGLAKYTELAILQKAAQSEGYQPVTGFREKAYDEFNSIWKNEINQLKRQANQENEVRFYYTGMAQAFLLDRLAPGWKGEILKPDVWLEDLLKQAIN